MSVLPYMMSEIICKIGKDQQTSSKNGYPRSIRARLETSLAGMRVFPFLGYSLLTVVPPLLLEERLELEP